MHRYILSPTHVNIIFTNKYIVCAHACSSSRVVVRTCGWNGEQVSWACLGRDEAAACSFRGYCTMEIAFISLKQASMSFSVYFRPESKIVDHLFKLYFSLKCTHFVPRICDSTRYEQLRLKAGSSQAQIVPEADVICELACLSLL